MPPFLTPDGEYTRVIDPSNRTDIIHKLLASRVGRTYGPQDEEDISVCLDKLESSGLNYDDAVKLGIELHTSKTTQRMGFKSYPSLRINYHDQVGHAISDPPSQKFFRIRYLPSESQQGLLAAMDIARQRSLGVAEPKVKPLRYVQPVGTGAQVYVPRWPETDWPKLLSDPTRPIIVTEGELKAAKACKQGFPCLGLGGVNMWQATDSGLPILPFFDQIDWYKRHTYIAFDSDSQVNHNVQRALYRLTETLGALGAVVHLVVIPQGAGGTKQGLDDFLVAQGAIANEALSDLLANTPPQGLLIALHNLNRQYVHVENPGVVIGLKNFQMMKPTIFKNDVETAHARVFVGLDKNGKYKLDEVHVASKWLSWRFHHTAKTVDFLPGKPQFEGDTFNLWRGWGVEPVEGRVDLFLALIDHLFTDADPAHKKWFIQWLAFPLQNPGVKMHATPILVGGQGIGKSLIGLTMQPIYGPSWVEINNDHLHDGKFSWADGKQFVLGNELHGTNRRKDANLLKNVVTQKEVRVDIKFLPVYAVTDRMNYLLTSNHVPDMLIDDDDRRFFIYEIGVPPLERIFYQRYVAWLFKSGGASNLFHYLLNVDLADFAPQGKAPSTQTKTLYAGFNRSDIESWCRELLAYPPEGSRDLYTAAELREMYDPERKQLFITTNRIARTMHQLKALKANDGGLIGPASRLGVYYVIRNTDKWASATRAECIDHLREHSGMRKY